MSRRRLRPEVLQDIVRNGVFFKYAARRYPRAGGFAAVQCDNCGVCGFGNMLALGRSMDLCLKCAVKAVARTQNCIGCRVAEAAEYVRTNSLFTVSEDTTQWNSIRLLAGEDGVVTGAASVFNHQGDDDDDDDDDDDTDGDGDGDGDGGGGGGGEGAADTESETEEEDDHLRYIYDGCPEGDTTDEENNGAEASSDPEPDQEQGQEQGHGHFFAQVTVDADGNLLVNGVSISQLQQEQQADDEPQS
jgi:hypothetical protein